MSHMKLDIQTSEEGQFVPCNEGILILDEIKVVQKTLFNSKSDKMISSVNGSQGYVFTA